MNKISGESMHVRNASDEDFGEMQVADLNYSVTTLRCTPVKLMCCKKKPNKLWGEGEDCTSKSLQTLPVYSIFTVCH